MENIKTLTQKEVCEKVDAILEHDDKVIELLTSATNANCRYNEVRYLKMALTEEEVKANVTEATLLTSVEDACEKLNRAVKIAAYGALFEMRKDAMPAILLGALPQYARKDETTKDDNGSITTSVVIKKSVPVSVKNYDAWANKEHKVHIVADTSYFARVDTLAYHMLTAVAKNLGIDALTNYKFANGFTKDIAAGNIYGTKASKTTIAREVQKCLDALLFVARDDGKNTYKVISKDVTYLQQVVCGAGKDRCSLQAMKANKFLTKVEDVMYRIVANKAYSIAYAQNKAK